MGRLDNIIARNRRRWPREKTAVMIAVGLCVLVILALMVFTDLGRPGGAPAPARAHDHVDGVLLRRAR